jgi:hypothetical protein
MVYDQKAFLFVATAIRQGFPIITSMHEYFPELFLPVGFIPTAALLSISELPHLILFV